MINIKRLLVIGLFISCFFYGNAIYAQRYNQFDKNKKRTGVWKKYYPNKRLRYIGTFKDGKEVGTFKFYSMSFSRNPEATKLFHKNSDSVTVNYFFDNGKRKGKGMLLGRKKVGKWIYYYKKGGLFSEENYIDGKLSGKSIIYFKSNGKIAEEAGYKEGLLHGHVKNFSDKGVLLEDVIYKDGKPNGVAKYYELNGNLKETGVYKNGIRVGKWEFYLDGEQVNEKKLRNTRKNKIKQKE